MILRLAMLALFLCPRQVSASEITIESPPGDGGTSVIAVWKRLDKEQPEQQYFVVVGIAGIPEKVLYASGSGAKLRCKEEDDAFSRFADGNHCGVLIKLHDLLDRLAKIVDQSKLTQSDLEKLADYRKSLDSFPSRIPVQVQVFYGRDLNTASLVVEGSGSNSLSWFNSKKLNLFLSMMAVSVIIALTIILGRSRTYTLRKVPALAAIDEALGRATEMGKPVMFLVGLEELKKVSTLAALSILENVAERCAKFGTQLKVPHRDPVVFTVAQEATKQAYLRAGRPDLYKDDINFFITDDQFGFTAAVDGIMLREKPAACIYMGYYFAESLILAETGASIGAIQIAGTDAEHQLPFFVSACDHTLIGEELYAAAAYLTGDKNLVSTLRAQDIIKGIVVTLAIAAFVGAMLSVCDVKFMEPPLKWVFKQ